MDAYLKFLVQHCFSTSADDWKLHLWNALMT